MATRQVSAAFDRLRMTLGAEEEAALPDAQLLENFIAQRDDASFQTLVRRHGRMVMGVCLRVTRNQQDAEDAFQATFLVLVRKAASLASRELLASWLYRVAHNTALKANAATAKRTFRERQVRQMPEPPAPDRECNSDLLPYLDQELSRLSEKCRTAIILCDLEGKTQKRAAQQLGCSEKALSSRLSRGRNLLAKRLARYGFGVSAVALAALVEETAARASVPMSLVRETAKAATLFAGNVGASHVISAKVTYLVKGVLKTMLLNKLKALLIFTAVLVIIGVGMSRATYYCLAQQVVDERKTTDGIKQEGTPKSDRDDTKNGVAEDGLQVLRESVNQTYETAQGLVPPNATVAIHGEWRLTSGEIRGQKMDLEGGGQLTITSKYFISQLRQASPTQGWSEEFADHYTIDPSKEPKQIDLTEPKEVRGIYSIEGDTLKICFGAPGAERPTVFSAKKGVKGAGNTVSVYKRRGVNAETVKLQVGLEDIDIKGAHIFLTGTFRITQPLGGETVSSKLVNIPLAQGVKINVNWTNTPCLLRLVEDQGGLVVVGIEPIEKGREEKKDKK
jgi:RNA polymerase sigma factor (sigma-70 family)